MAAYGARWGERAPDDGVAILGACHARADTAFSYLCGR